MDSAHQSLFFGSTELDAMRHPVPGSARAQALARVLAVAESRLAWSVTPEPGLVPPVRNSWRQADGAWQGIDAAHARAYQGQYRAAMLIRNMSELFAFCFAVTGDRKFLDRAEAWMTSPCEWSTWSGYSESREPLGSFNDEDLETLARSGGEVVGLEWDPKRSTYWPRFADTGIFTTFKLRGLAIGYDLLRGHLSAPAARLIRETLIREGQRLFRAAARGRGLLINRVLNHSWFDAASFGLAGLALRKEHPEADDWVKVARNKYVNSLIPETLGIDGEFPEPPACVWEYALMNGILFLEALRRSSGEDLLKHPRIREIPGFLLKTLDPQHGFGFNEEMTFDDAEGSIYGLRPVLLRLAAHLGDGRAQWLATQEALAPLASNLGKYYPGGPWFPKEREYNGHWEYAWFHPDILPEPPDNSFASAHLRDIGWVTLRSDWGSRATYVALKSGPYLGPHDKYDQNKFVLSLGGERFIEKPRINCYDHADFFRRTVGNNTLLVEAKGQDLFRDGLSGHARFAIEYKHSLQSGRILQFHESSGVAWAVGDATNAYSRFAKFHRYIALLKPNIVILCDDLVLTEGECARVQSLFHTKGKVRASGSRVMIDKPNGGLNIEFLLPHVCTLEVLTAPPDFDGVQNPYLAASTVVEGGGSTRYLVVFAPRDLYDLDATTSFDESTGETVTVELTQHGQRRSVILELANKAVRLGSAGLRT